MKKKLGITLSVLVLISAFYFIGSGFDVREDVFLTDYEVTPGKNEMTIIVGVASSSGYTRAVKNVSNSSEIMELRFYSAFGGVNGSVGENNRFMLKISPECREIYFDHGENFELILCKDEGTGEWSLAK